jgi:hypothetical protein
MSNEAVGAAFKTKFKHPTARLVLLSLADHHNRSTGRCDPSLKVLADDTCLSLATVKRALFWLEGKPDPEDPTRKFSPRPIVGREARFHANGRQTTSSYTLLFLGEAQSEPLGGGAQVEPGEGLTGEPGEGFNREPPLKRTGIKNRNIEHPLTPKGDECASEEALLKNTVTTAEAAPTVKSEVEPVTVGPRARLNVKEKSKKECNQVLLNLKTKPQKECSPLAAKRQANKLSDADTGYQAFCDAYKSSVRAAGRTGGVAGLAQGRKAWLALDEGKRAQRLAAIAGYETHLKRPQNQFKQPQHISTFINSGWEDFAEAGQSEAAPAVVTDDDKIRAVVWDITSDRREPDQIKRYGWESFGAVKQSAPAIWAEAVKRAKADHWRPYGELVALAA